MMRLFKAHLKNGSPVITVLAEGYASAGDKISRELNKNESRQALFDKWVKDGMLVEVKGLFRVYHTKDWALNSKLHFHKHADYYKPRKEDYELVASVKCYGFGEVFRLTNHIDEEWWENSEVTLIKKSRSTSVGDIVEDCDSGKLHLCASVGWEDVEWSS